MKAGSVMVRCVNCKHFDPKTRHCKWHDAYLTEKSAKKNIPCQGYLPIEKHHRVPDFKLVPIRKVKP